MRVELHASAVTSGPSYDNVQMLEDDEGLEFTDYWNYILCPHPKFDGVHYTI